MKVIYEFDYSENSGDYFDIKLFQHAQDMFSALVELEGYVGRLKDGYVKDDKEKIIEQLFDIIFDSRIGEIE